MSVRAPASIQTESGAKPSNFLDTSRHGDARRVPGALATAAAAPPTAVAGRLPSGSRAGRTGLGSALRSSAGTVDPRDRRGDRAQSGAGAPAPERGRRGRGTGQGEPPARAGLAHG